MSKMRNLVLAVALATVPVISGCGTISDGIADGILARVEPQLERIVDAQIEREERAAGIWGTPESYFYAKQKEEEREIRATAEEMISTWAEELRLKLDEMIKARQKGGR